MPAVPDPSSLSLIRLSLPDRRGGRRRDRRGRGVRGPLLPPAVPAKRDRASQFDDLVLAAIEFAERACGKALDGIEFAVEEIPPAPPHPWESGIRLGAYYPASAPLPPRIVLFRMPIVTRAETPPELARLVRRVLIEQVAHALGRRPSDIDPDTEY